MKKKFLIFGLVFIFLVSASLICLKSTKTNSAYEGYAYSQDNDVSEFLQFEQAIMDLNADVVEETGLATTNDEGSISSVSNTDSANEEVSEFALKRLIVQGDVKNTYGATNKISYNNLHVLCYSSEQATERAYQQLSEDNSLDVIIDKIEKALGYAEQDYSYDTYNNWGAEAADIGGYRQFLVDNNVEKEVVVVVMDTGINTSHPMFKDRLLTDENGKIKGFSYYDSEYQYSYDNLAFDEDDPNTTDIDEADTNKYSFEDDKGHGSHVAGIICDLTPKNVKILPIKIGNSRGGTMSGYLLMAYLRVLNIYSKQYNIVCTNLSFLGAGKNNESERDIFNEQCYTPLMNKNILSITAAGNSSYENNLEGLKAVVVSALKNNYNQYLFDDSYSDYGKIIDISAPGTSILSACISNTDSASSQMMYNSGTSMASPQVAGIVALLSLNPNLPEGFTASDMEQMLYDTCLDLADWSYDIYYGHGMVNIKYFEVQNNGATLSFYENGELIEDYVTYKNFDTAFNLTIECSNPDYKIIYSEKIFPTYANLIEYSSTINISKTVYLYVMGAKITDNKIVERTNLYNISYLNNNGTIDEYFDVEGGVLVNYIGNFTHLTIPSVVDGESVLEIGSELFRNSNIESIILPSSIYYINAYAFENCANLTYIYAPGVEYLMGSDFTNCTSLRCVSDIEPAENEQEGAYFPNLTKLGTYSFYGCSSLESVNLSKITEFPRSVFACCESLAGDFIINEDIQSIEASAFAGCNINNFIVDENNTNFYTDGLAVYSKTSMIAFASGNKNINYEILSSVSINNQVYEITTIGNSSMQDVQINNLTIPSAITIIQSYALSNSSINHLYYNADNCDESGYYVDGLNQVILGGYGHVKTIEISENVSSVPNGLFYGYFDNIIINSYDTLLENYCFYNTGEVSNGVTFNFADNVTSDYINMFYNAVHNINIIYSKTEIPLRFLSDLSYTSNNGEYYVYSKESLTNKFSITTSADNYGYISPQGISYFNDGESATYTITPNTGYKIKDVKVNGISVGAVGSYEFTNITSNQTISAEFVANVYAITYKDENENELEGLTPNTYTYGVGATLPTNLEKEGYVFVGWYNTSSFTGNNITSISATSTGDKTYYAKFEKKTYTITTTVGANGTISPFGTIVVEEGSSKTYTITPNTGYKIKDVKVNGVSVGAVGSYEFTNITSNQTISAEFVANVYAITYKDENGNELEGLTPNTYTYGVGATLPTNLEKEGYVFVGWYNTSSFTGNNITSISATSTGDKTYYAKFEIKKFKVLIYITGKGTVDSDMSGELVAYGEDIRFTFNAEDGWKLDVVYLNDKKIDIVNNELVISNIQNNITLGVDFIKENKTLYLWLTITIIGSSIVSATIVLSITIHRKRKKKKLDKAMAKTLVPDNELNDKINQSSMQSHSNIQPTLMTKIQIAHEFAKSHEEHFKAFCDKYKLDYKNDYNHAVMRYYQAYLRSLKK